MARHNITGQQGEDGHTLVFVEVKTRRDGSLSSPLGAVTPAKMYRLSQGSEGQGPLTR